MVTLEGLWLIISLGWGCLCYLLYREALLLCDLYISSVFGFTMRFWELRIRRGADSWPRLSGSHSLVPAKAASSFQILLTSPRSPLAPLLLARCSCWLRLTLA